MNLTEIRTLYKETEKYSGKDVVTGGWIQRILDF